jgi:hypothetical protein
LGKSSSWLKTVAPVVVKPDIDSKNALEKERLLIDSVIRKGRVPKRDKTIQKLTTIKTPSLSRKLFFIALNGHHNTRPPKTVRINENTKVRYSPSENIKSTNRGGTCAKLKTIKRRPKVFATILNCI